MGHDRGMRHLLAVLVCCPALALGACSSAEDAREPPANPIESVPASPPTTPSGAGSPTTTPPTAPPTTPPRAPRSPRLQPGDVRISTALAAIDTLAGDIGPRPGHTPAYFRAADYVEQELTSFGWSVERQRFRAPAGTYDDRPIDGGASVNLIATRGDVRPGRPYLIVGAHLDTVAGAPGAEDNASGVGTLLAIAEAAAERRTRLPVVLVAFGAEEPRGPGDDDHHYGSRAYVASLSGAERRSLQAMVSLDRVGVGAVVPVGSPAEPNALTDALQAAARRVGVPTTIDPFQRSSDHWSFARDGLPGARLGSTPYAGYHSPGDVPAVVDRAQLARTAHLLASWLH